MIFCHTLFDNAPTTSSISRTAASTTASVDPCAYSAASLLVRDNISLQ